MFKLTIKISYVDKLSNNKTSDEVWSILCEVDNEFVPSLSARESSFQNQLQLEKTKNGEINPHSYFKETLKQDFILAIDTTTNEVVGFMTFINNYSCKELDHYSPSNYITTIAVSKAYRGKGITKDLYRFLFDGAIPVNKQNKFITTRTWSTNYSHLKILEQLKFQVAATLTNHRGQDIDTIYFVKHI